MEVILRDHVDNLGKRGDVVKVADGYARNFLLPRNLALPATDANKQRISRERKIVEARRPKSAWPPKRSPTGCRRSTCRFPARSATTTRLRLGDQRRHRGPSQEKGFDIDRRKILLPDAIRALGETHVPVKLHRDVTAQLKLTVVKE
jgi:large subunit ribosomal protein L9